jgi:molecular chaperone HtpG
MGFMGNMPKELNIVVNANHSIISKILKSRKEEKKTELAKQAYDLALLSQNMLDGADLTNFIQRSVQLASD